MVKIFNLQSIVDEGKFVQISVSANTFTFKTVETNQRSNSMKTVHDVSILSNSSTNDDANIACTDEEEEDLPIWIKDGGFILIFLGMIVLFWGLAEVCDHYFCASLLVLCEENKIPDNVILK